VATMMTCNAHGQFEGERCPAAGCTEFWRPYLPPAPEPPRVCEAPGCAMPRPCPLHPQAAEQPELRAHMAAREPLIEIPSTGVLVRLQFPWGPIALPASGRLNIGRDFGAECGCQIAEFDNVSRRHAVIRVEGADVVIEDQLSTNGTTVNGEPITAYRPRVLREGDALGFGAHLRARVEMEGGVDDHH